MDKTLKLMIAAFVLLGITGFLISISHSIANRNKLEEAPALTAAIEQINTGVDATAQVQREESVELNDATQTPYSITSS